MYIVHRDVLTQYAGKSVNHPLSHMESFNISSLSVESLWLKAKPKNSNRISHLFLVLLLFMFFCCCLLVWVFLPWCCFGVFQLHLLLFLGALIDIDWMPGTKMVRHSTHMALRNCWQYKIIYVKSNKLNKIPFLSTSATKQREATQILQSHLKTKTCLTPNNKLH